MTNQISAAEVNATKIIGNFTQLELDTLQHTIAAGTNPAQFELFVQTCVNSGLNPFLNHIYCVVYGSKMNIQVSVEGVLHLARKKEGFQGVDVQLIHENDDFEAERNEHGEWKITQHKIKFPRGKVMACYAVAQKEGYKDVIVFMEANEVEHQKTGNNKALWNTWFNDMFKKHVMKRAAKLQYGVEINEDEQMISAVDEAGSYTPGERKEISPGTIEIDEGQRLSPEEVLANCWDGVKAKLEQYGMSNEDMISIIKEKFNIKPKDMNPQQIMALSKFIDLEHANLKKSQAIDVEIVEKKEAPAAGEQQQPAEQDTMSFDDIDFNMELE